MKMSITLIGSFVENVLGRQAGTFFSLGWTQSWPLHLRNDLALLLPTFGIPSQTACSQYLFSLSWMPPGDYLFGQVSVPGTKWMRWFHTRRILHMNSDIRGIQESPTLVSKIYLSCLGSTYLDLQKSLLKSGWNCPQIAVSVAERWNLSICISYKLQVMLRLLVCGPHIEWYCTTWSSSVVLVWEVESNDESESPRGCFRSVHISLALLSILCFGVFPQIRLGPEKETGALDKSSWLVFLCIYHSLSMLSHLELGLAGQGMLGKRRSMLTIVNQHWGQR